MFRCLFLGLLGVSMASSPVHAQSPSGVDGPAFFHPDLQRLPPVEPVPPVAEESAESPESIVQSPRPSTLDSRLWEGSFELGLDGSEGNTETFNFRFGFKAQRKTPRNRITLDLDYRKQTDKYVETANRAFFDWRYEHLSQISPWTGFVHGTVDYDEFQLFDARVTMDIGFGRQLIESEGTSLAARLGGGFSHEIDSPDDSYVPEAVFGLDFEHRLNERQKLTAVAEYTPDMTGMNDFRLRSRASWEALIDERMNLSLKLSVLDRYDSTPNGARRNDLDYSAVLMWKF